ncbi:MAG TPA: Uma2 family endonuclease [Chloroflexota bacterium]|nr:Uma2 family endonuclease [Chloroflexota bacterium]
MAHAFMPVSKVDFSTFPSSDGLPMAENDQNRDQMVDLISALKRTLNPRGHYVTGNMLLYYNQHDGWEHFSPDVFVALGAGAHSREKWQTWIEGKFPEVVFEILSPSTRREDFGHKVTRYHELGAREAPQCAVPSWGWSLRSSMTG